MLTEATFPQILNSLLKRHSCVLCIRQLLLNSSCLYVADSVLLLLSCVRELSQDLPGDADFVGDKTAMLKAMIK